MREMTLQVLYCCRRGAYWLLIVLFLWIKSMNMCFCFFLSLSTSIFLSKLSNKQEKQFGSFTYYVIRILLILEPPLPLPHPLSFCHLSHSSHTPMSSLVDIENPPLLLMTWYVNDPCLQRTKTNNERLYQIVKSENKGGYLLLHRIAKKLEKFLIPNFHRIKMKNVSLQWTKF